MHGTDFFTSVTFLIILVNTLVSLAGLYLNSGIIEKGYLKPYRVVRQHTWYELITSGFLHANMGHLFVNMFTLYFFGIIMEDILGPEYFAGLYVTGLIISGIPSVIKFRNKENYATLGASGAVGAVLFAFIFIYPMRSIYLFLLPVPIPAIVFGIVYLVYSMYESKQARGKINHEAHLSGALWGIMYLVLFVPDSLDRFLRMVGI
ncbi:MAG: rhomboid family intramembrane serine protease [Balneolaceae bacterium]